jgi:hypothetical protein
VFCSECYIALTRQPEYTSKVAGKDYIKCPMCRESVLKEETSHVSTRKLEVKPREPTTGHTIKPNHYDYSLAKNELAHIRIKVRNSDSDVYNLTILKYVIFYSLFQG